MRDVNEARHVLTQFSINFHYRSSFCPYHSSRFLVGMRCIWFISKCVRARVCVGVWKTIYTLILTNNCKFLLDSEMLCSTSTHRKTIYRESNTTFSSFPIKWNVLHEKFVRTLRKLIPLNAKYTHFNICIFKAMPRLQANWKSSSSFLICMNSKNHGKCSH